jgi:GT2 family glycosyltransferase
MGQVIQPWQEPAALQAPRKLVGLEKDFDFPFNSSTDDTVENVIACNLSVVRQRALSIGGFDENFIGSAYRFETDFARRVIQAGGQIRFVGSAGINHLRVESGGTRSGGSHLTSPSPTHGFGDYYYAFRHGKPSEAWAYSFKRMFREVRTKFHLTHPWWIPVKLLGEVRALHAGRKQARLGPKLLSVDGTV